MDITCTASQIGTSAPSAESGVSIKIARPVSFAPADFHAANASLADFSFSKVSICASTRAHPTRATSSPMRNGSSSMRCASYFSVSEYGSAFPRAAISSSSVHCPSWYGHDISGAKTPSSISSCTHGANFAKDSERLESSARFGGHVLVGKISIIFFSINYLLLTIHSHLVNLFDSARVPLPSGKRRFKPFFDNFLRLVNCDKSRAERKRIGIIVFARRR